MVAQVKLVNVSIGGGWSEEGWPDPKGAVVHGIYICIQRCLIRDPLYVLLLSYLSAWLCFQLGSAFSLALLSAFSSPNITQPLILKRGSFENSLVSFEIFWSVLSQFHCSTCLEFAACYSAESLHYV